MLPSELSWVPSRSAGKLNKMMSNVPSSEEGDGTGASLAAWAPSRGAKRSSADLNVASDHSDGSNRLAGAKGAAAEDLPVQKSKSVRFQVDGPSDADLSVSTEDMLPCNRQGVSFLSEEELAATDFGQMRGTAKVGVPAVATPGDRSAKIGVPDDFHFEGCFNTPPARTAQVLEKQPPKKGPKPITKEKPVEQEPISKRSLEGNVEISKYETFLDAIGQKDARVVKSAIALLPWIPHELTAVGKPSRLERTDDDVELAVLRVLQSTGAARNNSFRLTLEKLRSFLDERNPESEMALFPMDIGMMEAFKDWLEVHKGCKSAAGDLIKNIDYARALGLPVPQAEELEKALARRVKRVAAAALPPNARNPPGPKMCIDVERMSICGLPPDMAAAGEQEAPLTKHGDPMPLQVYALGLTVNMYGTGRGDDIWASKWQKQQVAELKGDFIGYKTQLDKAMRVDVDQPIFIGGFEVERHPLLAEFAEKMHDAPCLPYFSRVDGDSKSPHLAKAWAGPGPIHLAPWNAEDSAKKSLDTTRRIASGMDDDYMKKNRLSGTHPERHIGPTVAGLLSWPDKEIDALGDWAHKSVVVGTSDGDSKRVRSARSSSTKYRAHTEVANVRASRRRYMEAARAFIARAGGYDKIGYETTWGDIIPSECPGEEFEKFYGATWSAGKKRVVPE